MRRTARSKVRSEWPTSGFDTESLSERCYHYPHVDAKESLQLDCRPRRFQRLKLDSHPTYVRIVLACVLSCILLFAFPGIDFRRQSTANYKAGQSPAETPKELKTSAILNAKSNKTLAPPGKPLRISSLSKPSLIDRGKLSARLAVLKSDFPDDDEVDIEVEDDLRKVYGLTRWPPLILQIPMSSRHLKEVFSVEISDKLFCSAHPCKVLLPVWARPLSPAYQIAQMQHLVRIAEQLNRTLVLPNVGLVKSANGKGILGLGTCQPHPFTRYFDASTLLHAPVSQDSYEERKRAVPMHPFLEWVKYRPSHPSAQAVIIDLTSSNETRRLSYTVAGAEVRVDDQVERGRGRHKNCLSSKASKLKFKAHSGFVVSPARYTELSGRSGPSDARTSTDSSHEDREIGEELMMATSSYFDGILAFLGGGSGTSDDSERLALVSEIAPSSLDLGDPDVIVVEWNLRPSDSALSEANLDKEGTLDYSARLHALAGRIVSALPKPLIMLRSNFSTESVDAASSRAVLEDQACFSRVSEDIEDLVRSLSPAPSSTNEANLPVANATTVEPERTDATESPDSTRRLGTMWLDQRVARELEEARQTRSSVSSTPIPTFEAATEGATRADGYFDSNLAMHMLKSSEDEHSLPFTASDVRPATLDQLLSRDAFQNLLLTNLPAALSSPELSNPKHLAWLGDTKVLEDMAIRAILEEIVERRADRVFALGCTSERRR